MSVEPIAWNSEDAIAVRENSAYPYVQEYSVGSTAAQNAAVGPFRSNLVKPYPGWTAEQTSDLALMDVRIFQKVIQTLCSLGLSNLYFLTDSWNGYPADLSGVQPQNVNNWGGGGVPLTAYLQSMFPPITPGAPASMFDMDRWCMRQIPPLPTPLPLPIITADISVWGMVPALMTCNTGMYVENIVHPAVSPPRMLFIYNDSRFCQPPAAITDWPVTSSYPFAGSYKISKPFNVSVTSEQAASDTQIKAVTRLNQFSNFGNLILNSKYFNSSQASAWKTDRSSYSVSFPWAINLQLFRYFPSAPIGVSGNAFLVSGIPLLEPRQIAEPHEPEGTTYWKVEAMNPIFHVTASIPTAPEIPLYIPWGFLSNMNCCNRKANFLDFSWNPSAYPPLPTGVEGLPQGTSLTEQICKAQGWSFGYVPGSDCYDIGYSICGLQTATNIDPELYGPGKNPRCECWNTQRFIQLTLGSYPAPAAYASTAAYLESLIQCAYADCSAPAESLKNPFWIPTNGTSCPDMQNCIISDLSIEQSGPNATTEIVNSCYSSSGSQQDPNQAAGAALEWGLFAVVIAFGIAAILLHFIRKRRTKKEKEKEKQQAQGKLDDEDEYYEDLDDRKELESVDGDY